MSGRSLVLPLLLVVLAGAGIAYLLGGDAWFGGSSSDDDGAENGDAQGDMSGGGDGDASGAGSADGKGPVLFARTDALIGEGELIGRVVDFQTKEPVKAATVTIAGDAYDETTIALSATTGENGSFHMPAVPSGPAYTLHVDAGDAGDRVLSISVAANDVTDLQTIWLGQTGVLEGVVRSASGEALRGAIVEVHPGGMSQAEMMQNFFELFSNLDRDPKPIAQGESEAGGKFKIENVAPGPFTLIVRQRGFKVGSVAFVMSQDGAVGGPVEVRLARSAIIKGQVVDVDGRGVGDARVALIDQSNVESGFYGRYFSATDEDGYFEIGSPPAGGRLLAIVAADGYPTRISELKPEDPNQKLVLYGGATLVVRVIHADGGAPIEGAQIVAMLSDTENLGGNDGNLVTGLSDHNGEVELEARPGFMPIMLFSHPDEGSGMYMGSGGFGAMGMLEGPESTKIEPGDNLMIFKKKRGFIITGVVRGPDGAPMPGVKCSVGMAFGGIGSRTGVTDEDGVYRLASMTAQGAVVNVTAPGYVQDPETRAVGKEPESGNVVEHDVQLLVAASVTGRVVDPQGVALSGVQVRLSAAGGRGFDVSEMMRGGGTVVSDNQGRFRISNVVAGTYHVVGKRAGYVLSKTDDFEVENGKEAKSPDLKMRKGVELKINVVDASGSALKEARVEVSISRKEEVSWDFMSQFSSFDDVYTDASGIARVRDVPDGVATITATAKGSASTRKTLTIDAANPPGEIRIRMREAIAVNGVVVDDEGNPVANATIVASGTIDRPTLVVPGSASGTPAGSNDDAWIPTTNTTTDSRGRFEIQGMPDGTFSLTVRAEDFVNHTEKINGRADGLRIELRKKDPALQGRIDELQKELMEIYGRMASAKDDGERKAIQAEAATIQQELQRLRKQMGER